MAHGLQRFEVAFAGLVQDLAPLIVVGGIELVVQAHGRGAGRAIDALGQVVAIGGLLSACLE